MDELLKEFDSDLINEFEERLKPIGLKCEQCNIELNSVNQSPEKNVCMSCYHE